MMIKAATELQTAQNMIDDLLEFVLDSNRGYYNSRTGLLNVGLEEINENPGNNLDVPPTATAYVYGLRAINIYIRYFLKIRSRLFGFARGEKRKQLFWSLYELLLMMAITCLLVFLLLLLRLIVQLK